MEKFSHVKRVRVLYKTILKLHRGLPNDLRLLGDNYVKDEFKRHKTCTEQESNLFMMEWADYALTLAEQLGIKGPRTSKPLGKSLDEAALATMRDEQVYQLYELMLASQGKEEFDER